MQQNIWCCEVDKIIIVPTNYILMRKLFISNKHNNKITSKYYSFCQPLVICIQFLEGCNLKCLGYYHDPFALCG